MSIPIIQMLFIGMLPSWLKVRLYRLRGARIGKRARIGIFSVLLATEIEIGDDCQIGFATVIKAKKIALGNRVKIGMLVAIDTNELSVGHDSVIMEQNFIGGMRTPRSRLQISSRVKIFPFCFINPTEPIVIEDDVGIGGSNYLFTHDSWQLGLDGFPVVFGPIRIRKGAWLPWRVFVMPNVEIGTYATLGAGSVVTRSIPGYSLAVGTPAKIISKNKSPIRFLDENQKWLYFTQIVEQFRELLEFDGLTTPLTSRAGKLGLQV